MSTKKTCQYSTWKLEKGKRETEATLYSCAQKQCCLIEINKDEVYLAFITDRECRRGGKR